MTKNPRIQEFKKGENSFDSWNSWILGFFVSSRWLFHHCADRQRQDGSRCQDRQELCGNPLCYRVLRSGAHGLLKRRSHPERNPSSPGPACPESTDGGFAAHPLLAGPSS